MSEPVLAVTAAPARASSPPAAGAVSTSLQLVRLPLDRSQVAASFLRTRARGVMDLIAHFWGELGQTPPLQRGDLHLVVATGASSKKNVHINISTIDSLPLEGAMLYVPKAHRADILAVSPAAAAAMAAYICHLGARPPAAPLAEPEKATPPPPHSPQPQHPPSTEENSTVPEVGEGIATLRLTDLTGKQPNVESIAAELPAKGSGNGGGGNHADPGGSGATGGNQGNGGNGGNWGGGGGGGAGGIAIDFLTGEATGIGWVVPLLLPLVHKRTPARQLTNVVMQLPADVECRSDARVRPARDADIPVLNRWRRLYKEERGILFDADMDALVEHQRVFVYDLPAAPSSPPPAPTTAHTSQQLPHAAGGSEGSSGTGGGNGNGTNGTVVAVAKIDLNLQDLVEIGGVYTFAEHRQKGYGAALMSDMAQRIRQMGKVPTLQVDESNTSALRMYEKAGWRTGGRLARVWLTG